MLSWPSRGNTVLNKCGSDLSVLMDGRAPCTNPLGGRIKKKYQEEVCIYVTYICISVRNVSNVPLPAPVAFACTSHKNNFVCMSTCRAGAPFKVDKNVFRERPPAASSAMHETFAFNTEGAGPGRTRKRQSDVNILLTRVVCNTFLVKCDQA